MKNNHINYIEFKATDLKKTEEFYQRSFGWSFKSFGPSYIAFSESGLYGGFEKTDKAIVNGALVVLYHEDLNTIKDKITNAGGKISKEIFIFPGGHRFHFVDPSGNELAVWSDK